MKVNHLLSHIKICIIDRIALRRAGSDTIRPCSGQGVTVSDPSSYTSLYSTSAWHDCIARASVPRKPGIAPKIYTAMSIG